MDLFDEETEKIVLGTFLQFPYLLDEQNIALRSEDFYYERHRFIYEAILKLADLKQEIDISLVANILKEQNLLEKVGGTPYLLALESVGSQIGLELHTKRIRDLSLRRKLLSSLKEIEKGIFNANETLEDLLLKSEKQLSLIAERQIGTTIKHIRELTDDFVRLLETLRQTKGVTGIATHFRKLDELTGGFRPGQMIVLAARPGVGKSTLALNIAQRIAVKGDKSVLIFSLEMTQEELLMRMVCSEALVESQKIMKGFGNLNEIKRLGETLKKLSAKEIYIDESTDLSSFEFKLRCRRLANKLRAEGKPPIGLIVVDYLQLMSDRQGYENRQAEVAAISRSMKLIAKELNVPVLAVSQMNRAIEQRGRDPRPQLSDLRESGAIEQDADMVIFIHREELYNPDTDKKGMAEIIIAKHRGGPTDKFDLVFQKSYNLFLDPEPNYSDVVPSIQ